MTKFDNPFDRMIKRLFDYCPLVYKADDTMHEESSHAYHMGGGTTDNYQAHDKHFKALRECKTW